MTRKMMDTRFRSEAVQVGSRSSPVITALARGLSILRAFGENGDRELSLGELARRASLSKSTTHRFVRSLIDLGYMKQNENTGGYYLRPLVLSLGYSFLNGMDLKELADPHLRELFQKCGQTVNMSVLDGMELVYVERFKTQQIININVNVGFRLPLYNTAMGRALIAYQSEEWLQQYISALPPEASAYAHDNGKKLREILRDVRKKKYAINNQDMARELRSAAAPIWNQKREVVAAINIAVSAARISLKDLEETYAPQLLETAREISAALGYR